MDWSLPPNLSAQGQGVDDMYYLILVITGIAFVLVQLGIIWFVVRYRHREGRRALYHHGSDRLELVWTAIPALVMVFLGVYSGQIWAQIKNSDALPDDAVTIGISAKQFEWNVTHPGPDGRLGTEDDVEERNRLHVPVDRPVVVQLTSEDVIHSFFVPELRVKQDAVPGKTIPVWFTATEPGELVLGCAELCGLGHYRMRARVTVHEPGGFEAWQAERAAGG